MPTDAAEQTLNRVVSAPTTKRHKSARWNRDLNRMQVIEETEDGVATAVYCRDGSRRMVHLTGKEGALLDACSVAKLLLVPVLVPKSGGRRGRGQVEAIMGGMDLSQDLKMQDFIGYENAERLHARESVDPCEKTESTRITR